MVSKQRWSTVFQIKDLIWQKYAKHKLAFISAWPSSPDVECSSLCGALLWSDALFLCSHAAPGARGEHRMPLQASSTAVALSVCWAWLCLWGACVLLPQSSCACSWLATQVALAALNCSALKQRGSIHLFCIALGRVPQLGPVCCSCDLREWIFLSFKFGVFETTYMLDVLTAWTQGLYVRFHEDILMEWKACWEVLNRLGRTEGVTLSAFFPILVFGISFWSEVFPELCLVFVLGETVGSIAGGCSQAFLV